MPRSDRLPCPDCGPPEFTIHVDAAPLRSLLAHMLDIVDSECTRKSGTVYFLAVLTVSLATMRNHRAISPNFLNFVNQRPHGST